MGEELASMWIEIDRIHSDLENEQTVVAVSEPKKMDQQEVVSLQQLRKGPSETAAVYTTPQCERNKLDLVSLKGEIKEQRNKLSQENRGRFLSAMTKSTKKSVSDISSVNICTHHEDLEKDMKKAQEEAQILKSVVVPLESGIKALKVKLEETEVKLEKALKKNTHDQGSLESGVQQSMDRNSPFLPDLDSVTDLNVKVEKLFSYLKAEKAARKDLEMYVAVMSTQKSMLQDEAHKVNSELQDVCHLLEQEKQSHENLKQTWQRANDQFLESQRLMMMDLRRMEGVLTTEQQRQITDLRRKATNDVPVKIFFNEVENHEGSKVNIRRQASLPEFDHIRRKDKSRLRERSPADGSPKAANQASASMSAMNGGARIKRLSSSSEIGDEFSLEEYNENDLILNFSAHEIHSLEEETESIESATVVRISPEKVLTLPPLTPEQMKAITDPTPETEAFKSLVAGIKSQTSATQLDLEGKRLVSEKEWALLEEEMRASREKLGQPCRMCSNYEAQLQTEQEKLYEAKMEMKLLERSLDVEKETNKNLLKCQEENQLALKNAAEDSQTQINDLTKRLQNCEKCVEDFKDKMSITLLELQDHCNTLAESREEVQHQLTKLQEENDTLVDKYSKTAQQLRSEGFKIPNNLKEMQLQLRKFHEGIILTKVAKEHTEKTLKSEIMFLKSQVMGEQQEKTTLKKTMTQEITALQAKVAELHTLSQELKQEVSVRVQIETKLGDTESTLKSIQIKSKQILGKMHERLEEIEKKKGKLESENKTLRDKVRALQVDLSNNEAVQRDFVKLSQSLQIQLEKIREAENEVRWQHEDDIDDCNNCKLPFTITRRKHHCWHCGHIFCTDCTTKSVTSGRHLRAAKVCDVCHTILVKYATPYFSTEAPDT